MVILAVSDVHIGYSKSDVDDFKAFLKETINRPEVESFVVLGDCFDMWRRDVSGIFLENHDILESLLELKQKKTLYYIVGNHDYHLLKLIDHKYPFEFKENLTLPAGNISYVFKHGWEFDDEQCPPVMEALCDNLSDEGGQIRSDIWSIITSSSNKMGQDIGLVENVVKRNCGKFECIFEKHRDEYLQRLLTPPPARTSVAFGSVEEKAAKTVKEGELLVFGHTHRPFVSPTQNLVNTGSWNTDEKTFNTWVELEGKNVKLMKFGVGDVTAQLTQTV
jgi:UDP-2,3-diacylglucosamine pyrophosphatase LpxH